MKYYPVFLDLRDRWVLVVGGGRVAERKTRQLLEAGARVRVVSREIAPTLRELARSGRITVRLGEFEETDLGDVWFVIGATDDPMLHQRLAEATCARQLFCLIVDEPARCTAISPAVVARGDVQIAISTGGSSPALARHLKRKISRLIGPEYAALAKLLGRWRGVLKEKLPDSARRAAVFRRLVSSDLLELLRAGRRQEAEEHARRLIERALSTSAAPGQGDVKATQRRFDSDQVPSALAKS